MLTDILSYLPAFTWWNALLLVAFLAACWGVASLIALRLPIPHIMGIPFIGSPEFFLSRGDFLEKGAKKYGEIFSFRLAQHKVYAVSGPETRQLFFSTPERTVSMTHGYRVLFGGVPKLEDVVEDVQKQEDATPFIRQLLRILSSDKLAPAVQDMISYTKDVCQVMGDKGEIDPFDTIFKLIFRYSCRLVACKEIVDNPALLKEVHQIYNVLDEGGKMIPVLFPNLPTPEKKRRTAATTRLYMILMEIINNRQKNNVRHEDALQVLLDEEKMQVHEVVGWVLGALFAAVINTGMTSAWTLCYLAQHPEWRDRVMKEYDAKCEEQGTGKGLQGMTLAVLESLNELELVMREVMRLTITGTTLRRIMQKDVYYKGNHLEAGAFMAYRLGNTHLNSSPYTNPEQFDPERFLPPREEHLKEDKALMIWGVGKHPCVGMRVAKIEMKLMVMMMLHNFDFEVKTGPLPMPDINNTQMSTPAKPVIVSYTRRAM